MYSYSICRPDKDEIEHPDELITANEAMEMLRQHPWESEIEMLNSMQHEDICYSPSISFSNPANRTNLEFSASESEGELIFEIWFQRKIALRRVLGFIGNKEHEEIYETEVGRPELEFFLQSFLRKDYFALEQIMNKR